jgi:hypothetical protein
MRKRIILITLFSLFACKNKVEKTEIKTTERKAVSKVYPSKKLSYKEEIERFKASNSKDSVLSNDIQFINDSILKGKFNLDISQYEVENAKKGCLPTIVNKDDFYEYSLEATKESTKRFKNLGDLNGDKKNDYVFILPSLGWCEEGQSYYFTNNKIPRIESNSNCCHIESVFSIGDIDEDGGNEIAEYNSSCASSFKIINIWTLKKGKWEQIEQIGYKTNDEYKPVEDFHKLYKKISKGKFKFLEIHDIDENGKLVKEWKTIIMK